ncbi:MAG: PBP1A family penicillin-binding protein [Mariprofundus sp.]|nr:PBP1A family penicillin-binding protein [Mariprofundus sp.]
MRIFSLIIKFIVSLSLLTAMGLIIGYMFFSSNLPKLTALSEYQPPLVSRVYSSEGVLLAEYADEHRILTPFDQIPSQLVSAFLAAEDQQFYEHPGINPARVLAAALANLRAGHTVQGGSTITQQVAKNFLLTSERSYTRKIREAILSYRIEQAFTKEDILYLYLNQIYLGRGSYGVTSAAWRYFHKSLAELTLAESAVIAGLPKAPGRYAPHINPKKALQRRNTVLRLMQSSGMAKGADVARAIAEPMRIEPLEPSKLLDAYADQVSRELIQRFGETTLRRQGLTIIIPYSIEAEKSAISAVRRGLLNIEQRQYYRYPTNHPSSDWKKLIGTWRHHTKNIAPSLTDDSLFPALVLAVSKKGELTVNDGFRTWNLSKPRWHWKPTRLYKKEGASPAQLALLKRHPRHWMAGDEIRLQGNGKEGVRLAQEPSIESALYAIDLERGTVLARVGGYKHHVSGFDRVGQAKRQPGSAFKPLLYTSALANGFTPASIIMDTPLVFDGQSSDSYWRPENYKNEFAGPVTLRNALEHSRNLASIKVLQNIGIQKFINDLQSYPLQRTFPAELALALGAAEVTPEALTESYAVLATHGQRWKPISIQQVQDRTGKTLYRAVAGHRCQICHADPVAPINEHMRPAEQVIDPVNAYLITHIMEGVIQHGTGRRALALKRPAAGKTGTTNNQVDAWFMGYTPQILTGVWTGRDTPTAMGRSETGAHAALPTWLAAMQAFHRGREIKEFTPPADVEMVTIDTATGLLPAPDNKEIMLEAFRKGSEPTELTPSKEPSPSNPETPEDSGFFELGM